MSGPGIHGQCLSTWIRKMKIISHLSVLLPLMILYVPHGGGWKRSGDPTLPDSPEDHWCNWILLSISPWLCTAIMFRTHFGSKRVSHLKSGQTMTTGQMRVTGALPPFFILISLLIPCLLSRMLKCGQWVLNKIS